MAWLVGIDTGGTFNDLIALEPDSGALRVAKVPSAPDAPEEAILVALGELLEDGVTPADIGFLAHGTTFATNALLEGRGAKAGLLITDGFGAVYGARGWVRPGGADLVDPFYRKPPMLVPPSRTFGIPERVDYAGNVLQPLDEDRVRVAARRLAEDGVEAIAVCYLFSFLHPAHEERTAEIVAEEAPGIRISLSSRLLPVIREYPRLSTTVIDAYVGPPMARYLDRLSQRLGASGVTTPQIYLMQSNGGLMRITLGARFPNETLLSGPSAGVVAAARIGARAGLSELITFDMGGTSADISVIVNGEVSHTSEGNIAGQDIGTPMLDIRTLGAGGGTVAHMGADGLLKVGPRSAGARPGPACYGHGGTEATVTDANLALGILGSGSVLGGRMALERDAAEVALARLGAVLDLDPIGVAAGIRRIVNNEMAIQLRLALQEKGQDPRRFTLVAFGGAGPLHAADLARMLGLPRVLVPRHPGITSASGLLQTRVRHTYLQSHIGLLESMDPAPINGIFDHLRARAEADALAEGFAASDMTVRRQIDIRYLHQGYQLPVDVPDRDLAAGDRALLRAAFDASHLAAYGQNAANEAVETVTFRVISEFAVPALGQPEIAAGSGDGSLARTGTRRLFDGEAGMYRDAAIYDRDRLGAGDRIAGPAVIEEFDSTTLIGHCQAVAVDRFGNLLIETEARP